jgi:hypothetical protein
MNVVNFPNGNQMTLPNVGADNPNQDFTIVIKVMTEAKSVSRMMT